MATNDFKFQQVKFPQVKIQLTGTDGNAYAILGRCQEAARKAKVPKTDIDAFLKEAMSGDYDHMLQTCFEWFQVR